MGTIPEEIEWLKMWVICFDMMNAERLIENGSKLSSPMWSLGLMSRSASKTTLVGTGSRVKRGDWEIGSMIYLVAKGLHPPFWKSWPAAIKCLVKAKPVSFWSFRVRQFIYMQTVGLYIPVTLSIHMLLIMQLECVQFGLRLNCSHLRTNTHTVCNINWQLLCVVSDNSSI